MALEEIFCQLNLKGTFLSSILHLLPLIYPAFTCVDPDLYSEYDPDPDPQSC